MSGEAAPRPNQREHILDNALVLLSEHGSAGMSMRRLAQACGLQVAAIYHYFPSKDALLGAVIDERRYSSRLSDPLQVDPGAPVAERLRAVFGVFWAGALEEERVLRLLLGEALRNEPTALPTGSSLLEVFRLGVVMALEEYAPEVEDPKAVSELYVAQVFSAFIRHIFEPGLDIEVLGSDHADVVVAAVLGPGH